MSTFCTVDSFLALESRGVLSSIPLVQIIVTPKIRAILVDWIITVTTQFKLMPDTLHLTVAMLDAVLSVTTFTKDNAQLYAITCLSLAAKKEEIYAPELSDYVYVADGACTIAQIIECEKEVFLALCGDLNFPTVLQALRMLSNQVKVPYEVHQKCKYISELIMIDTVLNRTYPPSVMATSIHTYCCVSENITPANIFNLPATLIDICTSQIISLCKRSLASTLDAARKKYRSPKQGAVTESITFEYTRQTDGVYNPCFNLVAQLQLEQRPLPTFKSILKLGEGVHGTVRKVEADNGVTFAYKKMITGDDGLSSTFVREVTTLKLLSTHSKIVKMVGFDEHGILLECAKKNLARYLLTAGILTHKKQLHLATQLCEGLAYMHQLGVMHRDIKPQNILVFNDGTLKYADFGLARGSGIPLNGKYTHEIVTLWYRPPEILLGQADYDQRVDVWSLGCVLYEIGENDALFQGDSEIDQLFKIFKVLGTPDESMWTGVSALPDYKDTFPKFKACPVFGTLCDPTVKAIVERCLVMSVAEEDTVVRAYMPEIMGTLGLEADDAKTYPVSISPVKAPTVCG